MFCRIYWTKIRYFSIISTTNKQNKQKNILNLILNPFINDSYPISNIYFHGLFTMSVCSVSVCIHTNIIKKSLIPKLSNIVTEPGLELHTAGDCCRCISAPMFINTHYNNHTLSTLVLTMRGQMIATCSASINIETLIQWHL